MTDDDIRKVVFDLYQKMYGTEPTEEQAKEFVQRELKPAIEYVERQRNGQQ